MHSKTEGNITEMCVMADLAKRGYQILLPFGENCRYDILVDYVDSFIKVQCKTGKIKKGAVTVNISRSFKNTPYAEGEVDVFAVYCPANGGIYYVPFEKCKTRTFSIRVEPVKNSQSKRINMDSDFQDFSAAVAQGSEQEFCKL